MIDLFPYKAKKVNFKLIAASLAVLFLFFTVYPSLVRAFHNDEEVLECAPGSQTIIVGETVSFSVTANEGFAGTGGRFLIWNAPGGDPSEDEGRGLDTFETVYTEPGDYTVFVYSMNFGNDQSSCHVTVAPAEEEPAPPTVKVIKIIDVDGDLETTGDQTSGGEGWEFVSGWWQDSLITGENGETDTVEVSPFPPVHGIGEIFKDGFILFAASCVGATDNGSFSGDDEINAIHADSDQTIICTFYNTPESEEPPPPIENFCPLPDSLGDVDTETIGTTSPEKTLQSVLDDAGYSLDAVADQKQYQVWNISANSQALINAKFIEEITDYSLVFGYYTGGSMANFVPVFKTADIAGYESVPMASAGPFAIDTGEAANLGFAIRYFDDHDELGVSATGNALTTGEDDMVIVYNPSSNKYILAFEDWVNGDFDYQDLVVEVTLSCEDIEDEEPPPPPLCPLPEITSSLEVSVTVNQPFSYTLTATTTGVTSTSTNFTVSTSSLPLGLSFSTSTGVISGTPTQTGTFSITISAITDCGIDSETLIITVNPVSVSVNGGGGGGGGGGSSRPPTETVPTGLVLGAAISPTECIYLRDFLRRDFNNDPLEVLKLQAFLINFEGHTNLALTGVFDQATFDAVSAFQMKYFKDILEPWGHTGPTGYVYILTKKKINEIYCQRPFPLNQAEINEIAAFRAFLQSLGGEVKGVNAKYLPQQTEEVAEEVDNTSTITSPTLSVVQSTCPTCPNLGQGQSLGSLATVLFTQPDTLLGKLRCLYWFILILVVLYILASVLKNVLYKDTPENARKRFLTKWFVMDIGIVIAIIVAYVFGWWCLILPLLIALLISLVWTSFYPEHNSMRASTKSWYLVSSAKMKSVMRDKKDFTVKGPSKEKESDKDTIIVLPKESEPKK